MSRRFIRNDFNKEKKILKDEEQELLNYDSKLKEEQENNDKEFNSEDRKPLEEENEDNFNPEKAEKYPEEGKEEDNETEQGQNSKNEEENSEEEKNPENEERNDDFEKDSHNEESKDKGNSNYGESDNYSEGRKNLGPNRNQEKSADKPGGDNAGSNAKDALKSQAADKISEQIGDKDGKLAKAQQLVTKASNAVKTVVNGSAFIGKMLVNPVFWIAIVLLIVVGAFASSVAVIGGNDYNKACDASGVGEVNVGGDVDDFTRQSGIASWLMSTPFWVTGDKPMNKEQAAAVIGNFAQESYGANPKAIQNDHAITKWQSCDNDCVLGWGNGGGQAIGIAQWDSGRRVELVKFAKKEGVEWHDLNIQLKWLKKELDGGYDAGLLKGGGFSDATKSTDEYTRIWVEKFERAGDAVLPARQKFAKEFYDKYTGGGSLGGGSSGLSTQCVGDSGSGAIDASNLVQLAVQISYSKEEKAAGKGFGVCQSLPNCGDSFSKKEFIEAKKMAEDKTGADSGAVGLTASCDRLAATLIRLTGVDEKFPWGGATIQKNYMDSSPKWKRVSCQEKQPGDVIAREGHIMVYIGVIDGKETISSASIALASRVGSGQGRAAHLSDMSCKGDSWFADGSNADGWRRVK